MDSAQFIELITNGSNKLALRKPLVNATAENSKYVALILEKSLDTGFDNSAFALRILELACKKDLAIIYPYATPFCDLLDKLTAEGAVRSAAKILELLTIRYFKDKDPAVRHSFTEVHLDQMVEAGFKWMINPDKPTAIKAYTMQTLYLLGTKYDWVHQELALVIAQQMPNSTIGYKNRGAKVVHAIENKIPLKL